MQLRGDLQGRRFHESFGASVKAEQRFDLATERFISGASFGKKGFALVRVALQGGVIKLLDALPSFSRHSRSSRRVPAKARILPAANHAGRFWATLSAHGQSPPRSVQRRNATPPPGSSAHQFWPARRARRRARPGPERAPLRRPPLL